MSETVTINVTINGIARTAQVSPQATLLETLRGQFELSGTKLGCGEGECGACTVLLDHRAVDSCLVFAVEADGCEVTTIEGVEHDGQLSALQNSFLQEGAVQCGFCIPGMVMSAHALLTQTPAPSEEQVREGLAGNLCRCAGYPRIVRAVLDVAAQEGV